MGDFLDLTDCFKICEDTALGGEELESCIRRSRIRLVCGTRQQVTWKSSEGAL